MAGNSIGNLFRLTTFGESHGTMIGGVVDGCPAGVDIDMLFIQSLLDRRRPGQSQLTSPRDETDRIQIVSGVFEGRSTGAPIAFLILNNDQRPADYDHLLNVFRPSHADYSWQAKYGHRDYRGGGRSSARETAARVAGGAIALLLLKKTGVSVNAFVSAIGPYSLPGSGIEFNIDDAGRNPVRCPDKELASKMEKFIEKLRKEGDTTGGVITCIIRGVPAGWGEPVFDRLQADLAKAMLSVNAVKGFEYGSGFEGSKMLGSQHNDLFIPNPQTNINQPHFRTSTNFSGGIQGGISNGMDIYFRVAFKPVATIMKEQPMVDLQGNKSIIKAQGRHDVCIVPRAVPVVESMAALVLADHYLRTATARV